MESAPSSETTWITALGAVTSVGLDAATTCASIRAGITRPAELEGHQSMDYLEYALTPTVGHVVPDVARGFSTVGRWLLLAAAAIEDLCASAELPTPEANPDFWRATTCFLVVPEIDPKRFGRDAYCAESNLTTTLRDPLAERVAKIFAPARMTPLAKGRNGVLEVMHSLRWQTDAVQRCIVIATDSLTDIPSLCWLEESRSLRNDMNPVGLSPGEASVALMFEAPRAAAARRVRAKSLLHSVAIGRDPERTSGKGPGGIGLSQATEAVLNQTSLQEHGTACFVADLNGEEWRARELAYAQQRVGHDRWDSDGAMMPVISTGDLGTAMPALQIAVATAALQRGYAGGSSALVTSSDRTGRVGAAVLGSA